MSKPDNLSGFANKTARILREDMGVSIKQSTLMNAIAKASGFSTWQAMRADMEAAQTHAEETPEADEGGETLTFYVSACSRDDNLHPEDQEVEGTYQIELNSRVPGSLRRDVALDVFHHNVPVKVLDDFDFEVHAVPSPGVTVYLPYDENSDAPLYFFDDYGRMTSRLGKIALSFE
ncbi:hypothetical protein A3709_18950 [Halioglobus sp. HI00S01]|nr:hypothetical protein A3709_18950 [Halioglobus sp. HI00S01]